VRPDDVITATWTLTDAYEKQGRSGPMLFVILEITYANHHDERLAVNRETLIYRPSADESGA